jgi:hypothetical protein
VGIVSAHVINFGNKYFEFVINKHKVRSQKNADVDKNLQNLFSEFWLHQGGILKS